MTPSEERLLRHAAASARARRGLGTPEDVALLAELGGPTPPARPVELSGFGVDFDAVLALAESQPERILLLEVLRTCQPRNDDGQVTIVAADGSRCICTPQLSVGRRRVDVAIFTETRSLAVEVDGFWAHDATPERAEKTKRRSRELLGDGWTVVPFAAREINRDVRACVRELQRLMSGPVLP